MRVGRAVVPFLIVGYGIAAPWSLSFWFPFTGSTPDWFPPFALAVVIVTLGVAVGVARGGRWALVPAVAMSLIALVWTATWLAETLSWYAKVIAVSVPLTVVAYAVTVLREGRRPSQHHTA